MIHVKKFISIQFSTIKLRNKQLIVPTIAYIKIHTTLIIIICIIMLFSKTYKFLLHTTNIKCILHKVFYFSSVAQW